jgi:hypothetical protein
MPETVTILNTLATPIFATITSSDSITPAKFISAYKVTPENKSTSPSGRHVGHYKAILKIPHLVFLHTTMMSIPFRTGMINPRLSRVMDIMLPKHSRCHRLRIIALFESDYNQAKCIVIGRHLTQFMEEHNLLPTMQHGSRPGRQCQGTVLKKVLAYDIVRITKKMAAALSWMLLAAIIGY